MAEEAKETTSVNAADIKELPAVASNFYFWCAKCVGDRYHKVLAHPTKSSAKLECEVCGKKSTFRLVLSGTKKKVTRTRKKAKSPEEVWNELKDKTDISQVEPYSMKKKFNAEMAIDHPKFGLGVITEANGVAINVTFQDGERSLVHNRQ
ncbi:MAG: hypothetical protein HRT45_05940 [Bdellovibrionales bacterium]|nr:hypothetical protein [Bdellovibrionales bacterium]